MNDVFPLSHRCYTLLGLRCYCYGVFFLIANCLSHNKFLLYTLMHCYYLTTGNFISISVMSPSLEKAQELVFVQIKSEEKGYKEAGVACILS